MAKEVERFDGSTGFAGTGDPKSVKHLHVLPFVEAVEQHAMELREVMGGGLRPLTWNQPWSEKVRCARCHSHVSLLMFSYIDKGESWRSCCCGCG